MKKVFLDYISSTPVEQDILDKMYPFFTTEFGNPQSRHPLGSCPKKAIAAARSQVAALIGASPEEVLFTSSCSESNNMILNGPLLSITAKKPAVKKHIITSAIEHHSVLHCCKRLERAGFEVTTLPVDKNGFVSPTDLSLAIREDTALVTIMHANNEIGTIQPLQALAKIAADKKIPFHTDGAGTVGQIPVDVKALNVSSMSFSSQQLYGPKGVGVLYLKKGTRATPMILGGIQESGKRAGTENVPGIVGMGAAAEKTAEVMAETSEKMLRLRNRLLDGIDKIDHTYITGDRAKRLPNIVSCCIQYIEGEAITLMMQAKGIMASSGSTCSSHALKASSVVLSIGIPQELAQGSLVFSLGRATTEEEIDHLVESLPPIVARLREMSPLYEDLMKQKKVGDK